ncbi:MAG: hypothetical protein AAF356_05120 [Planctomycetota bacterium]
MTSRVLTAVLLAGFLAEAGARATEEAVRQPDVGNTGHPDDTRGLPLKISVDLDADDGFGATVESIRFRLVPPGTVAAGALPFELSQPGWLMDQELSNSQAAYLLGYQTHVQFVDAQLGQLDDKDVEDAERERFHAVHLSHPQRPFLTNWLDSASRISRSVARLARVEVRGAPVHIDVHLPGAALWLRAVGDIEVSELVRSGAGNFAMQHRYVRSPETLANELLATSSGVRSELGFRHLLGDVSEIVLLLAGGRTDQARLRLDRLGVSPTRGPNRSPTNRPAPSPGPRLIP